MSLNKVPEKAGKYPRIVKSALRRDEMSIELRAIAQVRRAQEAITDAVKDIGSPAALSYMADVQIAASSLISALCNQAMEASIQQEHRPRSADVDAALKAAGYGGMAETKPSPYDRALDAVRHNAERTATHEIEIAAMDGRLHARTGDSPIKKHFVPKMSKQDQAEYIQAKIADAEQRFIRALVKLAE